MGHYPENLKIFDLHPFLSIIIPAYNEDQRLPATLSKLVTLIFARDYPIEIIVVDNRSTDGTEKIVRDYASRYPFIKYLYEACAGKGAAVRHGMTSADGEYLFFSDADLAVSIEEVDRFLSILDDYDIAIGSRELAESIRFHEPFYRHVMGRIFNILVQLLVMRGIRDTQCGFKGFRRAIAHDLFRDSRIDGWSFDVEILALARSRGYKIVEVPVAWSFGKGSKIHPFKDTVDMIKELLMIRRGLIGRR